MSIRRLFASATLLFLLPGVACLHAQQGINVLTWHNDISRTGWNGAETILHLSDVNATRFGKTGFFPTDGVVDAEPLFVSGLVIGGKTRNVVFVASEHDSVYAFDPATGSKLWMTSLLKTGETTASNGCSQIKPEIGITSTPVIDLSQGPNGAIYVVNMSLDASGNYHQRINALDLTTGAQLFGGPTDITAMYPGTGDNSSNGNVVFAPKQYAERAGLLEWNGAIYTAWTSHCDDRPYTGWIMSYNASTLQQTSILNLTPNGNEGAIWMAGAGLAATPTNIFFLDANGTFDTTLGSNGFPSQQDFGNAFIKLELSSGGQLQVADYYATDNTVQQSSGDIDLGSGGALILPTVYDNSGNGHNLAVGAGKDTNIYVVDQTNMGKYNPAGGYIYQVLSGALPNGEWAAPAYFDNKIYYGGVKDYLKAFTISNAMLVSTPVSQSANTFGFPGTTPSISSSGSTNGIVWALSHTSPAVLYAFNAENLSQELYDSNQSGTRDQFGSIDHFVDPMIAAGRVYVPTQTGVAVFGLLN
jgi:hypothetical protein